MCNWAGIRKNIMTIEQRKQALINWITSIQQEELIEQIEEFRKLPDSALPETILELLKTSSAAAGYEECIEHTSTRELLSRIK